MRLNLKSRIHENAATVGFMVGFDCLETLFSLYALRITHYTKWLSWFDLCYSSPQYQTKDDTSAGYGQKIVCLSLSSSNGNRFRDNGMTTLAHIQALNVFLLSSPRFHVMPLEINFTMPFQQTSVQADRRAHTHRAHGHTFACVIHVLATSKIIYNSCDIQFIL